jgi:hypothetical protein
MTKADMVSRRARVYQFDVLLFIWQERCNPVTAFEALSSQITSNTHELDRKVQS